jgi:ABC-type siderophore export system fused ATPase/permease subunit
MKNRITLVLTAGLLSLAIAFSALALIELHKIRFGEYPASLKDLKFLGEWDQIALNSVAYKRLENGYELNVVRGWVGRPELNYPAEFWRGLGLVRSNMKSG